MKSLTRTPAAPRLVRSAVPLKTVRVSMVPRVSSMAAPDTETHPVTEEVRARLDQILQGLEHKTRRVDAKVLKVLSVHRGSYTHNAVTNKPRVGRLSVDVLWEAQPKAKSPDVGGHEVSEPMQGLARVTLTTTGSCDRVCVSDVQLLGEHDGDTPRMPSAQPAPPDVMLAVESMDSVFMDKLNDFMWQLEEGKEDYALSSMVCEDDMAGSYDRSTGSMSS